MMNTFENLMGAYKAPILRYSGFKFAQNKTIHQSANAFFTLVIDERKNGKREPFHTRAVQHLKNVLKGGNEPACDAAQIWAYPATVCAILLCKNTPTIWAELSAEEIERCDLIMTAFGVISNFMSNDANHYGTGISLYGDVWMDRPTNYRMPIVVPGIAAAHYFGGSEKLDEILVNFDYDAFIEKARSFGFCNLLKVWTTPSFEKDGKTIPGAKELLLEKRTAYNVSNMPMDRGNVYHAGEGNGARLPYSYHGYKAGDKGIITDLVAYNHSGGTIMSRFGDQGDGTYTCYIVDGSDSPMEGKDGLMIEYNISDAVGIRSSGFYGQVDFSMEVVLLLTAKELGLWSEKDDSELYAKIYAGNTDHIYTLERGYMSQGMGFRNIEQENNLRGYRFIRALWDKHFPNVEV
jgi:hypothetical protein